MVLSKAKCCLLLRYCQIADKMDLGAKKTNVLIIGGTGTLSYAVLMRILDVMKAEVWIFNRGNNNSAIPSEVHILTGNFYDLASLEEATKRISFDVVMDFLSRTPQDIARIYPLFMNACIQYVFISTACVFRRDAESLPVTENSPKPNPQWSYSIEKDESEKMLEKLAAKGKAYYTIVRPYITYDDNRIPLGIAPEYKYHRTIIERIKNGKPLFTWNGGEDITTLTYVTDFAKAVTGLLLNLCAVNEDFNVVSNFTYKWKDVIALLYARFGQQPNVVNIPLYEIYKQMPDMKGMMEGDRTLDAIFDNTKIKNAVPGLDFKVTLEEGLDNVIRHYDKTATRIYDYVFDARVDRLIARVHKKSGIRYVKYKGAKASSIFTYIIYRYLPHAIASRLYNCIRRLHLP